MQECGFNDLEVDDNNENFVSESPYGERGKM